MSQTHPTAPTTVHFVLQGKGGVGKSFVSAILAQYLRSKTFLSAGTSMRRSSTDWSDRICRDTGTLVIDTGATTFLPLWNYILESEILQFLALSSRRVFVHCVIAGGQSMLDTINGFCRIAETTTEKNVVTWLNEHFGEVVTGGKRFEDFDVAKEHSEKLLGSVALVERNPNSYGEDIRQMLKQRLTLDEAIRSADFSLVSKQRLTIVRRAVFEQLDLLAIA